MTVQAILDRKGTKVVTVPPHTTIDVIAHRLRLDRIGAIIVSNDGKRVEGIISERDIVYGLAQHGPAVLDMAVSALMTLHPLTCRPDASIKDVMQLMTKHRIRHLPVMVNGMLAGIVSIGDVVKNRVEEMELEANVLHDYIVAHQ